MENGMKNGLEEVMLKKEAIEEKDVGLDGGGVEKNCGTC